MDKLYDMHYGSNPFTFQKAEELRKRMTKAEEVLWEALRKKRFMGLKFRRQHPIERFIVDFYCHKYKLVIELDGSIHHLPEVAENDKNREEELRDLGLNIIRFTNNKVIEKTQTVLKELQIFIDTIGKNHPPLFHPLGSGKRKEEEDFRSRKGNTEFKLYPNPAYDYITLLYQTAEGTMHYRISDAHGKLVMQNALPYASVVEMREILIDTKALSPGVYYFDLINDGQSQGVQKLIILE